MSNPPNPPHLLALADQCASENNYLKALEHYLAYTEQGEDNVSTWYALYRAAQVRDTMDFNRQLTLETYFRAYDLCPGKIEPLIHISRLCRGAGQLQTAGDLIAVALDTDPVNEEYFYEPYAWSVGRYLEYLRICLAMEERDMALTTADQLLDSGQLTPSDVPVVQSLRELALLQSEEPRPEQAVEAVPDSDVGDDTDVSSIPAATPGHEKRKLCIGMATYDDYDGVYFTVQALRMFHPEVMDEVEIIVIDNNPAGPAAEKLKEFDAFAPHFRYVPELESVGTMIRDRIFHEANSDYVLVVDCHVFIVPGAIRKLIDYMDENPDSPDFLQGPLIHDDLETLSTHFSPGWKEGMWGTWGMDSRGELAGAEPFDIPMQGLGLFACRREAWVGLNPRFRGFGGEEGYLHEKFRQAGGRTLCLPFLRWMHRFNRPLGVPYPIEWAQRIRNYMIGWQELGLDTDSIKSHFSELVGAEETGRILEEIAREHS